jgi:hypothetical protein
MHLFGNSHDNQYEDTRRSNAVVSPADLRVIANTAPVRVVGPEIWARDCESNPGPLLFPGSS